MPASTKGAHPTGTFRYSEVFADLAGVLAKIPLNTGQFFPSARLTAEGPPDLSERSSADLPVVHSNDRFDENTAQYR
jgi:hypothetical protein